MTYVTPAQYRSTPGRQPAHSSVSCRDDAERRHYTRRSDLYGLDYAELGATSTELVVYFIGNAPEQLSLNRLRIEGGRRVRDLHVTDLRLHHHPDPERDDRMVLTLSQRGDASNYTLRIVEPEAGRQRSVEEFDPRYAQVDFNFRGDCPSDLDCRQEDRCPPEVRVHPEIDYLAKDYATLRRLMIDRISLTMPAWQERHAPDLGVALVEVIAYVADQLSYYQDAVGTEAYLATCRTRIALRRHLRLVDYQLSEGCNARTWLVLTTTQDVTLHSGSFFVSTKSSATAPDLISEERWQYDGGAAQTVFDHLWRSLARDVEVRRAHNEIRLYTWDGFECCLPKGATAATLLDPGTYPSDDDDDDDGDCDDEAATVTPHGQHRRPPHRGKRRKRDQEERPRAPPPDEIDEAYQLQLEVGDVLVFEEVRGPKTGFLTDADPAHRHAVRLCTVARDVDPVPDETGKPRLIWRVTWSESDALPFPLCISTQGPPPECGRLEPVSVARGNVLLVEEGRTVEEELGCVAGRVTPPECPTECAAPEQGQEAATFRPRLSRPGLGFGEPVANTAPEHSLDACPGAKSVLANREPQHAVPHILLLSQEPPSNGIPMLPPAGGSQVSYGTEWTPRTDLIGSAADDRHFVVEMAEDRIAHLRFGDGEAGARPGVSQSFRAIYRVSRGKAGNVGKDTLTQLVFRNAFPSGLQLSARNPLAAVGGQEPEPFLRAKRRGPQAFRRRLERAITPDDYAAIVQRDFASWVQRARASRRFTGHRTEMLVVLDLFDVVRDRLSSSAMAKLETIVETHLQRYRRVGHDVRVRVGEDVPLRVELTVCVAPGYLRAEVRAELLRVLGCGQLPDGTLGLFHPDNILLGANVHASHVVATASRVEGVVSVSVDTFARQFDAAPTSNALEISIGPFEVARLDNDPSLPEHGVLKLTMEGGR